jgi:hypothetical protein
MDHALGFLAMALTPEVENDLGRRHPSIRQTAALFNVDRREVARRWAHLERRIKLCG